MAVCENFLCIYNYKSLLSFDFLVNIEDLFRGNDFKPELVFDNKLLVNLDVRVTALGDLSTFYKSLLVLPRDSLFNLVFPRELASFEKFYPFSKL